MTGAKALGLSGLIGLLREMGSALLAYSGGVDSTFLLKALELSGIKKALAVTSSSETTPEWDLRDALKYAALFGVEHRVIDAGELGNEDFVKNSKQRCFHCKDGLFKRLKPIAEAGGYAFLIDGSTVDDLSDYRPGMEAAKAHGVRSPLIEVGFGKAEVREELRALGIGIWDKPSSPCLSSRMPYGQRITPEGLKMVSRAEGFLRSLGFRELRVRHFAGYAGRPAARVEISEAETGGAMGGILEPGLWGRPALWGQIEEGLKTIGYETVSLDPGGFRSGKMNDKIIESKREVFL